MPLRAVDDLGQGCDVGTVRVPAGAALARADLAVDGTGRVLVYGSGNAPGGPAGDVVARFDAALGLDTTFGTGGLAALPAPDEPGLYHARDVHVHADGALTVVHQGSASGEPELLVHRLEPSGEPDPSFRGDGRAEGGLGVASTVAGTDVILVGRILTGAYATRVNGPGRSSRRTARPLRPGAPGGRGRRAWSC